MILTFEVRIDVSDYYGKKYIPYLKHILNGMIDRVGQVKEVVCLDEMMPTEKAAVIELEEWKSGRMDL